MAFGRRQRSGVGVGLLIVMMREVIERLKRRARVCVVGDAVLRRTVDIAKRVNGAFVVLVARRPEVRR